MRDTKTSNITTHSPTTRPDTLSLPPRWSPYAKKFFHSREGGGAVGQSFPPSQERNWEIAIVSGGCVSRAHHRKRVRGPGVGNLICNQLLKWCRTGKMGNHCRRLFVFAWVSRAGKVASCLPLDEPRGRMFRPSSTVGRTHYGYMIMATIKAASYFPRRAPNSRFFLGGVVGYCFSSVREMSNFRLLSSVAVAKSRTRGCVKMFDKTTQQSIGWCLRRL